MIHDRVVSRLADPDQSAAAKGLSRRKFMQVGAAAGGGLMLSLSLPFANGEARAADTETFAPNAFIRIGSDGQIVLVMPYVEMGQGTYTAISMLIAEELEVGPRSGARGACSAQRKAVRQPFARWRPGDRRLDGDTRGVAAAPRSGRRRENHAHGGGGEAVEC
jgi:CO/xanthine dehydrogenase Mo-binding subunit